MNDGLSKEISVSSPPKAALGLFWQLVIEDAR
jgi:hypothetical protein